LDLVLTSRSAGKAGKVPMCGLPYHAADSYISRLIKAGLKVAICEQVEDPAAAKGIVKRDVIRIITSGTFIDEKSNNSRYLFSLSPNKNGIGLAFVDSASGTIQAGEYADSDKAVEVISRLPVYECIFPAGEEEKVKSLFNYPLLRMKKVTLSSCEDWRFNPDIAQKTLTEHFGTRSLSGFGIGHLPAAIASAGALLEYLKQMHKQPMRHIARVASYTDTEYMLISPVAVYGLGLEQLIETIDRTHTAMGKRKLHYWVYHPLKNPLKILQRQQAVSLLRDSSSVREDLGRLLRNIPGHRKMPFPDQLWLYARQGFSCPAQYARAPAGNTKGRAFFIREKSFVFH
jgi:DNA mismatch repair protein MutS